MAKLLAICNRRLPVSSGTAPDASVRLRPAPHSSMNLRASLSASLRLCVKKMGGLCAFASSRLCVKEDRRVSLPVTFRRSLRGIVDGSPAGRAGACGAAEAMAPRDDLAALELLGIEVGDRFAGAV